MEIRRIHVPGNHESHTMNQMYGFEGEVKAKYTAQMAELFTEVYNWLPLAHCLNNRVLVSTLLYVLGIILMAAKPLENVQAKESLYY
jgi:hypothetical protein